MSELEQNPSASAATPAGWYPDNTGAQRWWDGAQWGAYAPVTTHQVVMPVATKEVGVGYLFLLLLGEFGAHQFYLGRVGLGITQGLLFLIGAATSWIIIGIPLLIAWSIWWVIDIFLLPSYVRGANARIVAAHR